MLRHSTYRFHLAALFSVIVWGATFVSTKVLIAQGLTPAEIFLLRFSMAYLCILPLARGRLLAGSWRDEALLAAAGMAALPGERAVWSAPQQNAVAVMAAAEDALAAVHERLGDRARYTTPLLCVPQASVPTVWMYYAAGLLYIKVYDGKLRFAEVVPAPDEADLLYMLERLGSEFRLRDYTLRIGSGDGRALKRKLGGYFRQIVCE